MLGLLLLLANSTMGRNECGALNGRESHSKAPKMLITFHRVTEIFIRHTHFQKHLITETVKVNFKVVFILEEATRAERWSRGVALLFL